MNDLLKKKCVPCEKKGIKPFDRAEAEDYLAQTSGWTLVENSVRPSSGESSENLKITKEYKFQDFIGSINFVNLVADIAEMEGHHPDIHIFYNKVLLELSTHAIGGLSENDFILAAKIDAHK